MQSKSTDSFDELVEGECRRNAKGIEEECFVNEEGMQGECNWNARQENAHFHQNIFVIRIDPPYQTPINYRYIKI